MKKTRHGERDAVAQAFQRSVENRDLHAGDVRDVIERGSVRRVRRTLGLCLVGSSLVIALLLISQSTVFNSPGPLPPGIAVASGSEAGAIEVFVFKALDASGMIDVTGELYEVAEVVPSANDWVVDVDKRICLITEVLEICRLSPGNELVLTVSLVDSELRIVETEGEVSPDQRDSLLEFRLPSSTGFAAEEPSWVFSTPQIVGSSKDHIEAAIAWSGPIPIPGYSQKCRAEVVTDDGSVLWSSGWDSMSPPPSEETRTGGIVGFGREPIPTSGRPRIACQSQTGSGWIPTEQSLAESDPGHDHDEEGQEPAASPAPVDSWSVATTVVWNDPADVEVFTRCDASVSSDVGVLGTGSYWLTPPNPDRGEPPFQDEIFIRVERVNRAPEEGTNLSASVSCTPITRLDYELQQ